MSNQGFETWNPGSANGKGYHNVNSAMLNLNDDYAHILSTLVHNSSSQAPNGARIGHRDQPQGTPAAHAGSDLGTTKDQTGNADSQSIKNPNSNNNGNNNDNNNNNNNNNTGNGDQQPNLDLLLQYYQELFSRSGGAAADYNKSPTNSSHTGQANGPTDASRSQNPTLTSKALAAMGNKSVIAEKPCDHCRRKQIKCVIVPDLSNCVQCETKGIKCVTSERPEISEIGQDRSKRNRVDENVNVHELLKRSRPNGGDTVSQYYTDLLQNLNQSSSGGRKSSDNTNVTAATQFSTPYIPFDTPGQVDLGQSSTNSLQNGASPSHISAFPSYNSAHQNIPFVQPPIQYPRSSFYVGPTSVFDINLVNHVKLDKIDQVQLCKTLALRKVAPNVQFLLRDDLNQQLYMKQEQEVDMVEKLVHPHGKILVDIFFKLIHPQFPILHERVFLEKYSRSYRELTAPLLAALYSLSLQWWDFHPQLVGFPKPDVIDKLNEIALRTFFDVIERPKLSIVQTGLLILQCRSESSSNWAICSEVVALAEDLGLGVDCQDWRLPRWERGLRRRLAWAVWLQDKWTSMMEARHSHLILGRNWLVKMLTDEDFPAINPSKNSPVNGSQSNVQMLRDVTSPTGNKSMLDLSPSPDDYRNSKLMFQHMISLSIILGGVMDTFYTLGALETVTRIDQVLKLAKPLQLKMREWYHSLPTELSMGSFQERRFNSNASLTLSYFAVELTLHRRIIVTLNNDTSPELVQVCRLAAKTRLIAAIEFVRDLKFEHINSFWYTCSTGNLTLIGTFAALLYITAPTKDEATIFRDCLRNYVWILRMNSKSFEKAGNSLQRIHMLLVQIPGLLTDDPPVSQAPPPPTFTQRSLSPLAPPQQGENQSLMSSGAIAQSPFGAQSITNQMKNLPPDILHQLVNIHNNMPTISTSNSPDKAQRLPHHSANDDSGAREALNELSRMSPATSSSGEKHSPRKTPKGRNLEDDSPPVLRQSIKEGSQAADVSSRINIKSKMLTPQSVTGGTGRNSKSSNSGEYQVSNSINFDMQKDRLLASRTPGEDSNISEESVEAGSSISQTTGKDDIVGNEQELDQQGQDYQQDTTHEIS
ncbi:LADA_0H20164g1_1 [Lachancea dasiensis]|uniref:LADA_0H20164g1_1 n=1 Tax=Lachancea dasiensis TaxID=1072105 RepID=A0A1G4K6K4_9SACH|nr:LADA_0H20164g1_1 [Lachancea dasiensis]